MEDWIDIVKKRLQDAEAPLPPGDWEEFEAASLPARRTRVLPWLIPALAVAAGLAAVLFLRKPAVPEDGIQVIQQPSTPVVTVADTADVVEEIPSKPVVAQAVMPRVRFADVKPQAVVPVEETEPEEVVVVPTQEEETVTPETKESVTPEPVIPSSSPFVPKKTVAKPVTLKVGPAVGVVASGGVLAALLVSTLGTKPYEASVDIAAHGGGYNMDSPSGYGASSFLGNSIFNGGYNYLETNQYYTIFSYNSQPVDLLVGSPVHHFPLKVGLSAWIPVGDRLYVSTGLDYSRYQSELKYSRSGERKQLAHYLGVPVRLDWVFASGKRFDVYVGGGLEGEFCVGASLGGMEISKDGFKLSLLGAGGVQMNLTQRLGLYVEPQLMWRIPTDNNALATYRSAHPLMFAVSSGLRIGF